MSNPPQAQKIIKGHLQFFTHITLSLSLFYIYIYIYIYILKILVKNLFCIQILRVFLILLEGAPIFFFFFKVNK